MWGKITAYGYYIYGNSTDVQNACTKSDPKCKAYHYSASGGYGQMCSDYRSGDCADFDYCSYSTFDICVKASGKRHSLHSRYVF